MLTLSQINTKKTHLEKMFRHSKMSDVQKSTCEYLKVLIELAHKRLVGAPQDEYALIVGELRTLDRLLGVLQDGD